MPRLVAAGVALALALPAAAAVAPPGTAPNIAASPLEEPAFMLSADGVQVFECRLRGGGPNPYAWSFIAPDATLYEGSRSVARMATPGLWESLSDVSSVTAVPRASQDGGSGNLPWLLMRAAPLADTGVFAGVTSIQRVNTNGGVAPASGCNSDTAGTEARVAFTADYYFYRRR
jgi:hypothetical protein